MKTITFIRHAKADKTDIFQPDYNRPLTERGIDDVGIMAKEWLNQKYALPNVVYCSPAIRTYQTAERLCDFLDISFKKINFEALLYEAWIDQYDALIKHIDDSFTNVWIVGHNPTITYAVSYYSDGIVDQLPTCGMAQLTFEQTSWKKVAQNGGKLQFVVSPKQFKSNTEGD